MRKGKTRRAQFLTRGQIDSALKLIRKRAGSHPWALIGGLAMQHYGSPRMTVDVDVVVDRELGSELRAGTKPLRIDGREQGRTQQDRLGATVDWVVRSDAFTALYEAALAHAYKAPQGYQVLLPEYLVVVKMVAGREKDHADLVWLLRVPTLVDRDMARSIAGLFLGGDYAARDFDAFAREADWINHRDGTP